MLRRAEDNEGASRSTWQQRAVPRASGADLYPEVMQLRSLKRAMRFREDVSYEWWIVNRNRDLELLN